MNGTATDHDAGIASAIRWTDTHCHVHDARVEGGPDEVIDDAIAHGVDTMITVGCDRDTSLAAIAVAEAHRAVHATVGLHPHDAHLGIDSILDLLTTPHIVAVGEAGLDYHYDHSPRDVQRAVFAAQIALAHEYRLPLVIHSREAWDDTFDILHAEGAPASTIFHCFTGGPDELQRALDIDAYISFSGIVSFPSAHEVRAAATTCPVDRLLIETDSPYLAPVPHRGRPNRPAWVAHVGEAVAGLRSAPVDEIAAATRSNARRAFPGLTAP